MLSEVELVQPYDSRNEMIDISDNSLHLECYEGMTAFPPNSNHAVWFVFKIFYQLERGSQNWPNTLPFVLTGARKGVKSRISIENYRPTPQFFEQGGAIKMKNNNNDREKNSYNTNLLPFQFSPLWPRLQFVECKFCITLLIYGI